MLHCLRDLNLVAKPDSEQALSKLLSNLSREKLKQETKIAGSSKKTAVPFPPRRRKDYTLTSLSRRKVERLESSNTSTESLWNAVRKKDTKNNSNLLGPYLSSIYFHRPTYPS